MAHVSRKEKRKAQRLKEREAVAAKEIKEPARIAAKASPPPPPIQWRRIWPLGKKAYATIVGVLALIILLSRFRPDAYVRIEKDDSLNPSDAFATTFRVDNGWIFSIYDVSLECHIGHATNELQSEMGNITLRNTGHVADEIEASKSATFVCAGFYFPLVRHGDVTVNVSYRPSWWPAHMTKPERFVIQADSEHKPHWFHQP
jgi:hypothetical protein